MWRTCLFTTLAMAGALACNETPPTAPAAPARYVGPWAGATSQQGAIGFVVSAQDTVVTLTIDYKLNGCAGTTTMSGLSLAIAQPQLVPGALTAGTAFDNPSFGTGSQSPDPGLGVSGAFVSRQEARGTLVFTNYRECGSGLATWVATKH